MIMPIDNGSRRQFKAVVTGYIVQEPQDTDDDLVGFIGQSIDVDPVAGVRLDDGVEVLLDTKYRLVELSAEEARLCELAIGLISLQELMDLAEDSPHLEAAKQEWNKLKDEYDQLWGMLGELSTNQLQTKLKEAQ